ncbi:Protein of unknown function [Gryllus bimaculatus]|nr:Protein of unknown function [Gryllus bimaculatus]
MVDKAGSRQVFSGFYQEIIHLSQLKSLNVGGNRFLKVQDLMTLALNCKGLQELKVAKRPPREGFGKLSDSDAVYMFTHLKAALVSLKMDVAGLGDAALLVGMRRMVLAPSFSM